MCTFTKNKTYRGSVICQIVLHFLEELACMASIRKGRERGFWAKFPFPSISNACDIGYIEII